MRVNNQGQLHEVDTMAGNLKKQAIGDAGNCFNESLIKVMKTRKLFPGLLKPSGEEESIDMTNKVDMMIAHGMVLEDINMQNLDMDLEHEASIEQVHLEQKSPIAEGPWQIRNPDTAHRGDMTINNQGVEFIDVLNGDELLHSIDESIQGEMVLFEQSSITKQIASVKAGLPSILPSGSSQDEVNDVSEYNKANTPMEVEQRASYLTKQVKGADHHGDNRQTHSADNTAVQTLEGLKVADRSTMYNSRLEQHEMGHNIIAIKPSKIQEPLLSDFSGTLQSGEYDSTRDTLKENTDLDGHMKQGTVDMHIWQHTSGEDKIEIGSYRQENPKFAEAHISLRHKADEGENDLRTSITQQPLLKQPYMTTTPGSLHSHVATIHNLPQIASMMKEKISTLKSGESMELKVLLEPERLGKVEIRVKRNGRNLSGEIFVESIATREAMENAIKGLKSRMIEQNLQLEHISVSLKQDGSANSQTEQGPFDNKDSTHTRFLSGKQEVQIAKGNLLKPLYIRGMGVSLNLLI